MNKYVQSYTIILAVVLTGILFVSYAEHVEQDPEENTESSYLPQVIRSVNLDKEFDFAGEVFPMNNFDVRERLERELSRNAYYHSSTLLNLKKSGRFFPVIEKILAEQKVPDDLKFLAVAESN